MFVPLYNLAVVTPWQTDTVEWSASKKRQDPYLTSKWECLSTDLFLSCLPERLVLPRFPYLGFLKKVHLSLKRAQSCKSLAAERSHAAMIQILGTLLSSAFPTRWFSHDPPQDLGFCRGYSEALSLFCSWGICAADLGLWILLQGQKPKDYVLPHAIPLWIWALLTLVGF